MALRSPVPFHNYWGINSPTTSAAWVAGELPNENFGNPNYYGSDTVQVGDFAYVTAASTFYLCIAAGTAGAGGATWVALSTGAGAEDRFAPKYLVGGPNDTAAALAGVGGFWFFPDTGDGAGIEAALTQAAILPGDVWIRPGSFNLTGVSALPLVIPSGVRLMGSGAQTVVAYNVPSGSVGTAFTLSDGSELRDLRIEATDASDATGNGVVELVSEGASAQCERVYVSLDRDPDSTSTLLAAFYAGEGSTLSQDRCEVVLTGQGGSQAVAPPAIEPVSPPAPTGATWTVGTLGGEDFPDLATALANASVVNGDLLLLSAQTFTTASTITVSKQVTIQGAGLASTVIQTPAAAGDPVIVIEVTTSNVTIRDLTVKQRKTTNTSVEAAISINPPGGGAGATGHFIEAVRVETMEFGIVIRSDGWQINNCQLAYVGAVQSNRLLAIYRSYGQGLFTNSGYDGNASTRIIQFTSTVGLPTEIIGGYIRFGNITPLTAAVISQFCNCDNPQIDGVLPVTLYVDNCVSQENSAFVVFFVDVPNLLGKFAYIALVGNSLTGNHGGTPVGCKGAFAVDGTAAGPQSMGTTTFYASGNVITTTTFRAGWQTIMSTLQGYSADQLALAGWDGVYYSGSPALVISTATVAPTPATALAGWRGMGPLELDFCKHVGGDAGVIALDDVDVDQSSFEAFALVGVYCLGADLAVTGGTRITSPTAGVKGIQCLNYQTPSTALVTARVSLPNVTSGTEVGVELSVASGQVIGSRVEASSGISSLNAVGRGVAIGFNNVISQAGQQINSQVVDEVAHNIQTT